MQKIEAALPRLAASPSISPEQATWITNQVSRFCGSFRKADADNPEVFTVGYARLFASYPEDIVSYVTDPLTGLPGKSEWLPSLRAVKAALDERHAEVLRFERLQAAERQQLAERRVASTGNSNRPTLAELKARYGPNWGLKTEPDNIRHERARALMAKANDRLLQREYAAPGVTPRECAPGIPMSVALSEMPAAAP
jgi:hypothetical protein